MILVKQFSGQKSRTLPRSKKSVTLQGQVLPLQEIIRRFASGNMIGISRTEGSYDTDDEHFEEHAHPFLDPSDTLLSAFEMKIQLTHFEKSVQRELKLKKAKMDKEKEDAAKKDAEELAAYRKAKKANTVS